MSLDNVQWRGNFPVQFPASLKQWMIIDNKALHKTRTKGALIIAFKLYLACWYNHQKLS